MYEEIGNEVIVKAVGTTGSGRYLTGDFIGADIIQNEIFENKTFEFGGPQPITIEEFLLRLYRATTQKDPQFVARIPLGMIVPLLGNIEKLCSSWMPVTAGQFSTFRNDGNIEENSLFQKHQTNMNSVDDMIKEMVGVG